MKNERWIICFDLETDGPDPSVCNVVELAAVPIDPISLVIKEDDIFQIDIQPPNINKDEYYTDGVNKTISWYSETRGVSKDNVIDRWKSGKSEKIALNLFSKYCSKYHIDKKFGQWFTGPISAGYNIDGFDVPILQRLYERNKNKCPLGDIQSFDLYKLIPWWFESLSDPPNYKMDTLREFFGMPARSQAHEAASDILDEAEMIVRFLKFHRNIAKKTQFRGAFGR
jgi:hypothetical protein